MLGWEACGEVRARAAPVALVGRVEAHVGDVASVQAGEALDLVREAAVLVPRLEQLAPHVVEARMVLRQQAAVLLAHLRAMPASPPPAPIPHPPAPR
jgi:hypothetical protein